MTHSKVAHLKTGIARTAAGREYRASIEALLDKASGETLAELWRKVCPLVVDELPGRQAVTEDLADIAEQLQPRLADMQADELCRLIEKYACPTRASSDFFEELKRRCS